VKDRAGAPFQEDSRINSLIGGVKLGQWKASEKAAIKILENTDAGGRNELFEVLLTYQDCPDEDMRWGAIMTIESYADLAPHLFGRHVLCRMANHPDFTIRSCAANVCMRLAQYAPELIPVDILIRLSVYDEDWYVQAPANAALKAMVRAMPVILGIFFIRLHSLNTEERAHAACALSDIAEEEPELLDLDDLQQELSRLEGLGDDEASKYLLKAVPKVRAAKRRSGYKYGI
jgi:hypothetical protein